MFSCIYIWLKLRMFDLPGSMKDSYKGLEGVVQNLYNGLFFYVLLVTHYCFICAKTIVHNLYK